MSIFPAATRISQDLSVPEVIGNVLYLIPKTLSYASWHADVEVCLNLTY